MRGGLEHHVASHHFALEQGEQLILGQGLGPEWRRRCDVRSQLFEQRAPGGARTADDVVVGALAPDVVVGRDGRQYGNAGGRRERLGLTRPIVLVDHQTGDADVAAELAEVFHRRTHIVGDIQGLQVIGADDDDLLAHVAGDRQAEPAAHHVAKKIQQHVVKTPLVKSELLEQFKSMDDPAPAAPAADLRSTKLHGEHAVALEAHIADGHRFARQLFLRRGFDDGRTGPTAEQQGGGIALRIAADQQYLLALLRHHVRQIGEREALADAALAVNGDHLSFLGRFVSDHRIRLNRRFVAQGLQAALLRFQSRRCCERCAHESVLQSKTIFKQEGSPKAVR